MGCVYRIGSLWLRPTQCKERSMSNAEKALADARGGSVLASVAVTAALGDAQDWPQHMRVTACEQYGLTPDDPAPIMEAMARTLTF